MHPTIKTELIKRLTSGRYQSNCYDHKIEEVGSTKIETYTVWGVLAEIYSEWVKDIRKQVPVYEIVARADKNGRDETVNGKCLYKITMYDGDGFVSRNGNVVRWAKLEEHYDTIDMLNFRGAVKYIEKLPDTDFGPTNIEPIKMTAPPPVKEYEHTPCEPHKPKCIRIIKPFRESMRHRSIKGMNYTIGGARKYNVHREDGNKKVLIKTGSIDCKEEHFIPLLKEFSGEYIYSPKRNNG